MEECLICLTEFGGISIDENIIELKPVFCSNPKCDTALCKMCLSKLIEFSVKEIQLPICPVKGCIGIFDYKVLSKPDLLNYGKACVAYLDRKNDDLISSKVAQYDIVSKLRRERIEYLTNNFPIGIYLISKIAMPSKLAQIHSKKYIDSTPKMKKKCMNTGCRGLLDEDLLCSDCDTQFCKECEKRLTKGVVQGSHQCNPDDRASIIEIQKIMKCPECGVTIYKYEGCFAMTCSVCRARFDYKNGALINNGSHNRETILTNENPQIHNMSEFISKTSDPKLYTRLIMEIESISLTKPLDIGIINILTKYRKTEQVEDGYKGIIKTFERYMINLMRYRQYIMHLNEIETELVRNELSLSTLKTIHSIYVK